MKYFINSKLDELLSKSKLVIFDMNGLILDDEPIQLAAVNQTLKRFDIKISEEYWIKSCVGKRAEEFFREIMRNNQVNEEKYDIQKIITDKNNHYKMLVSKKVDKLVRPGILDLLKHISKVPSKKLALASSATIEEITIVLDGLGIRDIFEAVLYGADVKKGKPSPEIYLKTSKKNNISPSDCLVFEDASPGINSAISAGMKCIAIPNEYTKNQDLSKATLVIDCAMQNAKILANF